MPQNPKLSFARNFVRRRRGSQHWFSCLPESARLLFDWSLHSAPFGKGINSDEGLCSSSSGLQLCWVWGVCPKCHADVVQQIQRQDARNRYRLKAGDVDKLAGDSAKVTLLPKQPSTCSDIISEITTAGSLELGAVVLYRYSQCPSACFGPFWSDICR